MNSRTTDEKTGKIMRGLGGLYTVRCDDGEVLECRAKGAFRHAHLTPLAGDRVVIAAPDGTQDVRIAEILPRRNALIRPAMSNLDVLFFVIAAKDPDPSLRFIDKLLSILEYQEIEPVLIITKCDLCQDRADKLRIKYEKCGFRIFLTDSESCAGDEAIRAYLQTFADDTTAAFSGVSGAGKSTLMNRLFPSLALETGEISEKIARGKHTTRAVQLYRLSECSDGMLSGCLADTPGFSMLDFERFDFFSCEELPYTFREFLPYLGTCKYTKCTHTKEDGCAILEAVREKKIPKSRHTSYLELYEALKDKKEWQRDKT